jgi:hypothetical protein
MGLEHIAPELKRQSLEFADLPEVAAALAATLSIYGLKHPHFFLDQAKNFH